MMGKRPKSHGIRNDSLEYTIGIKPDSSTIVFQVQEKSVEQGSIFSMHQEIPTDVLRTDAYNQFEFRRENNQITLLTNGEVTHTMEDILFTDQVLDAQIGIGVSNWENDGSTTVLYRSVIIEEIE